MSTIKRFASALAMSALALGVASGCLELDSGAAGEAEARGARSSVRLATAPTRFVMPEAETSWLGRGVDTATGRFQDACLTGDITEYRNRSLQLGYRYHSTTRQSLREITGGVSASVNLGLFGGGVSVQMHTRLQESENTAAIVYRVSYKGTSLSLENRTLTARGQSVVGASPERIAEICGDQYVDHMQLGNDLYFVAQMAFDSRAEYERFLTRIKVRVLFWTSTHTISDEFYELAQNGRYTIKVLSSNPLPAAIRNELDGIDGALDYGELSCRASSASGMSDCVDTSARIMEFLHSDTGYRAWLQDAENLGVTWFSSAHYATTGHREFVGVERIAVPELAALHDRLLEELSYQENLQNTLRPYARTQGPAQSHYRELSQDVDENIDTLDQAMTTCGATLDVHDCQSAVDDALGELIAIDF